MEIMIKVSDLNNSFKLCFAFDNFLKGNFSLIS